MGLYLVTHGGSTSKCGFYLFYFFHFFCIGETENVISAASPLPEIFISFDFVGTMKVANISLSLFVGTYLYGYVVFNHLEYETQ